MADPEAGRVDDLQIGAGGLLDAFQVKWSRFPQTFTFDAFVPRCRLDLRIGYGMSNSMQLNRLLRAMRQPRGSRTSTSYSWPSTAPLPING